MRLAVADERRFVGDGVKRAAGGRLSPLDEVADGRVGLPTEPFLVLIGAQVEGP